MTIFTRAQWAYWGDRIGVLVLIGGIGAFLIAVTFMMAAEGRTDLGPMLTLSPILGGIMTIAGIWGFLKPWPTRLEIDAKNVRVFYRPTKIVTITRKDVIGVKSRAVPHGGSTFGIIYKDAEGKMRGVNLYGGWRDSNGKRLLPHSMTKMLNAIFNTSSSPTPWY